MSRNFVKRGALMFCILAGLAALLVRRDSAGARSSSPSTLEQVGHGSADASQTRSSSGAVYVGPHTFSPAYEYCFVDANGRPLMIHRRRLMFFQPESPDMNDRTFIESDICQ